MFNNYRELIVLALIGISAWAVLIGGAVILGRAIGI